MRRRLVAGSALLLARLGLFDAPVAAQEPQDTLPADSSVISLDAVLVTTARSVTTAGGTSAILINPDSIRLTPAPTLSQVLREIPFVQVRENSRGEAELTLRGSESRQVAVLVDGVPLTLGWDHRTDASIIPVTGAQQILLVRGLHSVLYGPNVLGGVVEVGIAHGAPPTDERNQASVSAGVDHVGGRSMSAAIAAPVEIESGSLTVRAGGGYRARPGYSLASGVPDAGEDDDGDLRTNSDLELFDGFAAVRYHGKPASGSASPPRGTERNVGCRRSCTWTTRGSGGTRTPRAPSPCSRAVPARAAPYSVASAISSSASASTAASSESTATPPAPTRS